MLKSKWMNQRELMFQERPAGFGGLFLVHTLSFHSRISSTQTGSGPISITAI